MILPYLPPDIDFQINELDLPLRYDWALSRNSTRAKTNFRIVARRNGFQGWGEVAPNIRYQETPERILQEFEAFTKPNPDFQETDARLARVCSALGTGLDMAIQNLRATESGISLAKHLHLPEPRGRAICYTIPVMEPQEIGAFYEEEKLHRFSWLKIKVNQEKAMPMVTRILELFSGPIAIDGNEAWNDPEKVLEFTRQLDQERILFLEQPLPAADRNGYIWLKDKSPMPIWGDESILKDCEPDFWKSAFHGINVKLMKAGSLENAIHLLQSARAAGLQTMVGCMVETTLGISADLSLESLADYMDLDGFLVLENEPFHRVKERDGIVWPNP